MTEPILQLEHISYTYPDGPLAVSDLSVSVQKGERVAVLGRNGAGKSTFFLLCNGILEPSAGTIRCGGRLVTRKKKDLLELHRRIGIVFQEAENQILAVTVEGEVSFGPINLGLPPEAVKRRTAEAMRCMGGLWRTFAAVSLRRRKEARDDRGYSGHGAGCHFARRADGLARSGKCAAP